MSCLVSHIYFSRWKTLQSKLSLLILEIPIADMTSARVIERAYMLKLDCTSSKLRGALGSEHEHFPKDTLHNLEFTFNCSKCELTKAAQWVASKVDLISKGSTTPDTRSLVSQFSPTTWTREMQASSRAFMSKVLLSQVQ